jgi:hypothetical protein
MSASAASDATITIPVVIAVVGESVSSRASPIPAVTSRAYCITRWRKARRACQRIGCGNLTTGVAQKQKQSAWTAGIQIAARNPSRSEYPRRCMRGIRSMPVEGGPWKGGNRSINSRPVGGSPWVAMYAAMNVSRADVDVRVVRESIGLTQKQFALRA